jgi:hypothetical protein
LARRVKQDVRKMSPQPGRNFSQLLHGKDHSLQTAIIELQATICYISGKKMLYQAIFTRFPEEV